MAMKRCNLDPNKKPQVWKCKTLSERMQNCRAMLALHGFLTDAESERVCERIFEWRRQHCEEKLGKVE